MTSHNDRRAQHHSLAYRVQHVLLLDVRYLVTAELLTDQHSFISILVCEYVLTVKLSYDE